MGTILSNFPTQTGTVTGNYQYVQHIQQGGGGFLEQSLEWCFFFVLGLLGQKGCSATWRECCFKRKPSCERGKPLSHAADR